MISSQNARPAAGSPLISFELDPGMSYLVTAHVGSVATILGTITSFTDSGTGRTTEYFALRSALPASTGSVTILPSVVASAPTVFTFSVPAAGYSSTTAPSSSATVFVESTLHIGMVWNFAERAGVWSGSVTFYNSTGTPISLSAGTTYTLTDNTFDSSLTNVATDTAP